jgi:hypothetical protein
MGVIKIDEINRDMEIIEGELVKIIKCVEYEAV